MFQTDTELLNKLFDTLNEKTKFLILRNHVGLPNSNDAKDIDILLPEDIDPKIIHDIIKELAELLSANIIWLNELDYLAGYVLARESQDGAIVYAKLDFFYGLKWRGLTFVNSSTVLSQRIKVKNYFIPAPGHEALIHFLNGALYGKKLNEKYVTTMNNGLTEYRQQFKELLEDSNILELEPKIVDIIEKGNKSYTKRNIQFIRKKIIKALVSNQFSIGYLGAFLKSLKTDIYTRRGFGYLLSFSGPDGAGKSSIMESVIEFFRLTGICKQEEAHHFLPAGIPPLHRILKFNKKLSQQNYTQPYSEKPVGKLSSYIRFMYYVLAFIFAKYKYIKPQLKHNEVVIFDRYFPDLIADPTRARLSLNRKLISFVFIKVAAVPDVAVIFTADPATLIKRKGELTQNKAQQLVGDYRNICTNGQYTLLENNGTLTEGLSACFSIIFEKLHNINCQKLK